MTVAGIGLGANLGDPPATLEQAFEALGRLPGTRLIARSPCYRSAPLEAVGPDFLNAVALLETVLDAPALLAALHAIEREHGRERLYRNAPRTLDLDLLFHGDARIQTASLTVPHPRLHQRAFVLLPLSDVAPGQVLPGLGRVTDLLAGVAGQQIVKVTEGLA